MNYAVDSHPGVVIEDPEIVSIKTLDDPDAQTFTPSFVFAFGPHRIAHAMPAQPYVNGTWTDARVTTAIETYFKSISHE